MVRPSRQKNNTQPVLESDDPKQSKAFIDKAREVEADEDRSAADKLMGRMAKTKPGPRAPKAGPK